MSLLPSFPAHTRPRSLAAVSIAIILVVRYLYNKKRGFLFGDPAKDATRIRGREDVYDFDEYDVVIVGGGTAGCVLASRLTEDPSIRVLLLEAGTSSAKNPFAIIPASYSRLMRTQYDWNIFTYWPRAKLLGGCTCMNAMIFHIGAPEDFDEWVSLQKGQEGASHWTYKEINNCIKKFEKFNPSPKYPLVDASLRGNNGPVQTGYGYATAGTPKFIEACVKNGIPHVPDVNTPTGSLGVTKAMTYITSTGRRANAEFSYLTAEVLARPNLKVIPQAHVTRVLFDTVAVTTPRAVGVEFTQPSGDKFQVRARKEVIMSAGAVHTPHILMLSGVGPADHLISHGIPVVADLPGVGSHLMDHVVLDLNFLDKSQSSISHLKGDTFASALRLIRSLLYYKLTGSGPLTTNVADTIGFLRSDDPVIFPPSEYPAEQIKDTTSGPGAPDIEIFYTPTGYIKHGQVPMRPNHYFGLHGVLLRPTSTGTIRLKSRDPQEPPVIDPNYLSSPNDVAVLVRAARLLSRIVHTEPLASMLDPAGAEDAALDHTFHNLDDAAVVDAVTKKAETLYHPACTARMAPKEDGGVVDPFLRVHGIPNLRVVDASVFPMIVSGHTAAPVLAIAEKAADLIKAALSNTA
ncbi:GMC oxidoreductase [Daedaleopsis nitida]|nr:GMC oxidoreductase [Daedaleopsis nitida]